VSWPSGQKQVFENVAADRVLTLKEGEAALRPFVAARGRAQ
jgi:hypothetical protein